MIGRISAIAGSLAIAGSIAAAAQPPLQTSIGATEKFNGSAVRDNSFAHKCRHHKHPGHWGRGNRGDDPLGS